MTDVEKAIPKISPEQTLTTALIEAASSIDWDKVDNTLVPQLRDVDGNRMAQRLLEYVADESPDVRGVVATALASLKISDRETRKQAIAKMIDMTKDTWMFPAGGAAVFLLEHSGETPRIKIEKAIKNFAERAQDNGWTEVLTESIPKLGTILKT